MNFSDKLSNSSDKLSNSSNDLMHPSKMLNCEMDKRKRKKRSTSTTPATTATKVLCITTAAFGIIPVAQGFAPSGQSEFIGIRQQLPDLKYRVHDNSEERQCQHRKAAAKLLARRSKYNEPKQHHVVSNFFHTWWTASKSRRALEQAEAYAKQQEQQLVLDNYLESIDRRYKRLHKDHHVQKDHDPDTVTNVAWNFLMNSESGNHAEEQRRQMDAIYVLGLAELASDRLLMKHNLPLPQSKLKDKRIIDVATSSVLDEDDETKESVGKVSSVENIVKSEGSTLKLLASATFYAQLLKSVQSAYRNRVVSVLDTTKNKMIGSLNASRKAISSTLTAAANLIAVSGGGAGKYAIHFVYVFAVTVMANVLTVLRPLVKA